MRALVTWKGWQTNPAISQPTLDAEYYLAWARDIADGDVLGTAGTIGGEPFLLNPLFAYVIAPLVCLFGAATWPVLVFQTLLAGATAALAASAARRWAGSAAAWTAGLAVAFSAALTHLDGYVSVSGLAAFLVAAACFVCAPRGADDGPRRPAVVAGVLLGLSALARPVVLFAVPFVAWLFARREERKLRAAAAVLLPFALLSAVSLVRNAAVSGEWIVWTAANGQNAYIGNNAEARKRRAMFTDEIRFSPRDMHVDAKYRVAAALGHEPTRSEISSWYAARAMEEWREHPAESLGWTVTKFRWFFSPEEPASSADYDFDMDVNPALPYAFVPTWLLAALAVSAAFVCRGRPGLLLGPGSLVLAHLAACTLSFPLSHYRSPAIPAMAVLAGCVVAEIVGTLRSAGGRALVVTAVSAAAVAVTGRLAPQPAYRADQYLLNVAVANLHTGNWAAAERNAREALVLVPDSLNAWGVLMDAARNGGRPDEARQWAGRLIEAQPWQPEFRVQLARTELGEGNRAAAFEIIDEPIRAYPWSGELRMRRAELRADAGDTDLAKADALAAMEMGAVPPKWLRQMLNLPPAPSR